MEKINFIIRRASDRNYEDTISLSDLDELLNLIEETGYPIIISKNAYLEEYERDKKKFKERYWNSLIKRVQRWKRRKLYYIITIYDDYIE